MEARTWLLASVAFASCVLCVLYKYQNKLLYFPVIPGASSPSESDGDSAKHPVNNPPGYRHPGEHQLPYEDMVMMTPDGVKIHAWIITQPKPKSCPTILFFHGNAGNIGYRLPNAIEMYRRLEANIVMVDYRGYGASDGEPTEEGLNVDAVTALAAVRKRSDIDPHRIIIFGRSLGGAVAVSLAAQRPEEVYAVMLENTFLDIPSMVDKLMPWLSYVKFLVLRISWSSAEKIPTLTHPILFIAGEKDELVPHDHMTKLYEKASKSSYKMWHAVSNGTHNDTWVRGGAAYYAAMKDFLNRIGGEEDIVERRGNDNKINESIEVGAAAIPTMPSQPIFSRISESVKEL